MYMCAFMIYLIVDFYNVSERLKRIGKLNLHTAVKVG